MDMVQMMAAHLGSVQSCIVGLNKLLILCHYTFMVLLKLMKHLAAKL